MKIVRTWRILAAAAIALTACNLPVIPVEQPVGSARPSPLHPLSSGAGLPPATPSAVRLAPPTPTDTTRSWPPPLFGTPGPTQVTPLPLPADPISRPGTINILLAGSDRITTSFRTDTLILVNFQPEYDLVTLVSIPRDLFVYIPGWQMQRINAAYYHGVSNPYPGGGPGLLKDTILYNLGIPVDRVALADFDGFVDIIDTLGGVDVPVACAYTDWRIIDPKKDPEDEDNWKLFTLNPGVVHMHGDLALWYARSRKKSSDFDRSRRQQEVLRALYVQALRLDTLAKAPELYRRLRSSLTTDMDLEYLLNLLPYATRVGQAQVRSVYINKDVLISWRTPQGAAVLLPDEDGLPALLARALGPPEEAAAGPAPLVEIWNGTGHASWPTLTAGRLSYAGFDTLIADGETERTTQTTLLGLAPEADETEVDFLLGSLGLPADRFEHAPQPEADAQYRLVLGADYNPCFDPSKIER